MPIPPVNIYGRFIVATLALLAIIAPFPRSSHAQTNRLCFDAPGITNCIEGRFRQYWVEDGGLAVFGYPLTPAANRTSGEGTFLTQDFERNRFELHPENPAPYDVLLGRLGDDILQSQGLNWQGFTRALPREECRYFAETQHNVCDFMPGVGFRSYWESHGLQDPALNAFGRSLALFGLPLSEPGIETNREGDTVVTQWFERARFEWHPSNPAAFRVLLGRLGDEVARPAAPRGLPADVPWLALTDRVVGTVPNLPTLPMPKGDTLAYVVASPDGSRLLQQQQRVIGEAGFSLFVTDARTGERTELLDLANGAIGPVFSPDGTSIAFTTVDENTWQFRIMNLATKTTRELSGGALTDRVVWPVGWTRGGLFVASAIWGSDAPLSRLGKIDTASGTVQVLYGDSFWSAVPSEDGSRVALLTGNIGMGSTPNLTIRSFDVATSRATTIAEDIPMSVSRMVWSPNASRLLYVATNYETGEATLHTVGANATNHAWLTFKPLGTMITLLDAAWRSDATLLVVGAGERSINIYELPANDLRPEGLASRAAIPQRIHQAQFVRLLYVPRP